MIGRYSAKDNAVVPEANAGGVRIVRGTRQEVFDSLRASRLANIVMAVFLILVPTLAVWGTLAYRENWFDKQKKESVRTVAREAFVKATAIGDLRRSRKRCAAASTPTRETRMAIRHWQMRPTPQPPKRSSPAARTSTLPGTTS